MDWFRQVDNYCERLGPGYWAEPVNALSNLAFVAAAFVAWRMLGEDRDPGARILVANLVLIGIGSWHFHTHAQLWAAVADVAPIQAFILIYVGLATVRFFDLPWWAGVAAVALFLPYSWLVGDLVRGLAGPLNGSTSYVPVPILIALYGLALLRRAPGTGHGLLIGAGLLSLSLVFRTVDRPICNAFPLGSHFVWHLLNGLMLGWMIVVLHRHRSPAALAPAGRGG